MGLAQKIMDHPDTIDRENEAKARINSARLRDLAFVVRNAVGNRELPNEDVQALALAISNLVESKRQLSYETIVEQLLSTNRSKHKADLLARRLFP